MPTIYKSWTAQTWIEGTASTWTSLPPGTTVEYSTAVDLETSGYEGAHVIIEVDFVAGPTDDLKVKLYGSLDGTDFDDIPIYEFTIDNGTDPCQVSFIVSGLAHFRLGFQHTGSTDSHNVRAAYQAWYWESSV